MDDVVFDEHNTCFGQTQNTGLETVKATTRRNTIELVVFLIIVSAMIAALMAPVGLEILSHV